MNKRQLAVVALLPPRRSAAAGSLPVHAPTRAIATHRAALGEISSLAGLASLSRRPRYPARAGSRTVNVDPTPRVERAAIVPPITSQRRRQSASPRPVPPKRRDVAAPSACA